ncbi:MAG TPA: ATP-binding cassette domain-containing protein [Labilithrix sp.]|nr:ATP-binding cassette domain-containing protein [Labilithrix sp.]
MNTGVFRLLHHLVDRRARVWMGMIGGVRFVERVLLAGVALSFSKDHAARAVGFSVVLALLGALRAASRAPLLASVRKRFTTLVADILLHHRELGPAPKRDGAELVIFEALWTAEDLAAERIPGLVADSVAAVVLSGLVVCTLPASVIAVGVAALALAALAGEGARRISGTQAQRSWDAFLPVASSLEACIHGGPELVANGRDREQEEIVRERTQEWIRNAWRADWLSGLSGKLPILLGFVGVMIAIVYAQMARGVAPEAALAVALVIASSLPPFASVLSNFVELSRAVPKLSPFKELLEREPPPAPRGPRRDVPRLPTVIRWDLVDYAYPLGDGRRGPPILSQASGELRPGRLIGLAGPNGAGKSTLFRLLLGFDRPQAGSIRAGGIDLADFDPREWRTKIAYLSQRPFLPNTASLREAIRFLAPTATDGEMARALSRVGLWDRLTEESKHAPLDILVGSLSAGQRQRVAMARVLVQEAEVVLLDEPDANLDRAGVKLLGGILRELATTSMVVFIAHDEDLLAAADHVVRLGGTPPVERTLEVSAVLS